MVGPLALLPMILSQSTLTLHFCGPAEAFGKWVLFRVRGLFPGLIYARPHFTPAPHLLGLRKTQVFQRKIGLVGRHRESNLGLAWYSASTLPLRYGGVRYRVITRFHKVGHFPASNC